MMSQPKLWPQYVATLCATIGAVSMGTMGGYASPAGAILTGNETESNIHLSTQQNSWFSSIPTLGALIGSLAAGFCINTFGRRGTMILLVIPGFGGWAIIAGAQNFAMLLVGRIITGIFTGIVSVAVPTYIGEISSANVRGTLGSSFQLLNVSGILFAYCVGAAFDKYQWIALVIAIVPVVFSSLMVFNKESPAYLLSKGKQEEARKALEFFRGKDYVGISTELEEINHTLEESKENKISFRDLKEPSLLKPLLMSLGLMFFQQFSGINAVIFNLEIIFEDAGSDMSTTLSSIIVGAVQVLATFVATILTDIGGRKILLIVSGIGMTISLAALGVYFYLKDTGSDAIDSLGWLPLLSLATFIIAFSIGFGPIPWVMMGELFRPEVKETAASLAGCTNWTSAFLVTLLFSPLQNLIHDYGVYWMFSGICVVGVIFVFTFVYETKGKTLTEINDHFREKETKNEEKVSPS